MFWLNIHRASVIAVLAVVFWSISYIFYFNPIYAAWRKKGEPHSWSVDLTSKKTGGRMSSRRER
jgi:hypothetical protein